MAPHSNTDLLGGVLRRVSRSFYLSLAILPASLREPIGLAYLLARAADTVADTHLLPRVDRLRHLETLRAAFAGGGDGVAAVAGACLPHQALDAERRLLERVDEALARLRGLPAADRADAQDVLATLTRGMIFDLTHFPGDDAASIAALPAWADLDEYTYLVAGCVGPFWTALHVRHRPRLAHWDLAAMGAQGVRFGKALQMTNVLRDVPRDLRSGRCYLPGQELAALGLGPADLLAPGVAPRARPLVRALLGRTLEHYEIAWRYTLAIPRREFRMRLACAWALLIGLATLAGFAAHPDPLSTDTPVKIPRAAVRGIVARSALAVGSNRALTRLAARARAAVAV
jgi:farnesyl-diphosphate farnesyltransferase